MIFFSSNFSHLSSHLLISSLVIRWQLGGSGSDGVSGREVVGGVPLGWAAGATCSEKSASPLHPFKWGFPLSFCLSIESNSSNPTCQERSPQVNLLPTPFEIYKITFSFCLPIEPRELHKWETKFDQILLNPARR